MELERVRTHTQVGFQVVARIIVYRSVSWVRRYFFQIRIRESKVMITDPKTEDQLLRIRSDPDPPPSWTFLLLLKNAIGKVPYVDE